MKSAIRAMLFILVTVMTAGLAESAVPAFTMTQTLSDGAQRTTLAFSGLAMMTGNLEAQSFFPPGKVADYTGFQYLRDNDPDNMGHNTSFLTRIANNVIYILNDSQLAQLKTLAVAQQDQINLYGYKRFALMKAFRRLLEGSLPAGATGLDLVAVKQLSRELYLLDGQLSFDRALLYATILNSLDANQKAYLDAMKGKGWSSWPDITNDQVRNRLQGLPQGDAVAVMTYAGDLFSWYAGSLEADIYFCPERHGTYFGSFYIKDAPAIGHEGYSIDEQLTATAGAALCDSSKGYVTPEQAATMSSLVDLQRNNLYAGSVNIVSIRTQIATLLRSLLVSTATSASIRNQVLALSGSYGDLDGENNYQYATIYARAYQTLTTDQKVKLAELRKAIMSGTYPDGTTFDFSVCTTPFLYSAVISDQSVLTPYVADTNYLFTIPFTGNIVLGSPTQTTIKASILSPDQSGSISISYGTTPGAYTAQTSASLLQAGTPLVLTLNSLTANTQYYYRLNFSATGSTGISQTDEHTFHTARPTGSSFTFTIQADSHLDAESNLEIYRKTLGNVLTDAPDFHVDLGDTFMCEKHSAPLTATVLPASDRSTVITRYLYDRANFGLLAHSAPLFLVNGNHEGEAGWLNDGTANNLAVWATQARQQYFLNPIPDSFYSGDTTDEPFVGKRASWYAWQWGDALFVVLDPYWNSKRQAGSDPWNITLGERQYQWLQSTLASSTATFKFVFIHNLVGGLDGQMRGGVEAAPYFESGGRNLDGTDVFSLKRTGWGLPIHQLLVNYGVTALFHGHDHLYARQELDGVVYQEVPQPSAANFQSGPGLATEYHYNSGTIISSSGHLRVTVEPHHVTTQYVRAWLPADETTQRKNGQVDDTWVIGAPGWPTASFVYAPVAPVIGQNVVFTDTSAGTPTAWAWDFGDGGTSALQNPGHAYATAGTFTVSLTITNTLGSHTVRHTLMVAGAVLPNPVFSFAPTAPAIGQTVAFTDSSTGSPTAWNWNFGDGLKSNLQSPTHVYTSVGTYTISLKVTNAAGVKTAKQTVTVSASTTPTAFGGNIVLGSPTATSIKANIFTPNQRGTVSISYGTTPGVYPAQTATALLQAAIPLEMVLQGLSANTRYYYRLNFQLTGESGASTTDEFSFHTARLSGDSFTFCVQGDSHPERVNTQFNGDLYVRTLLTAAADQPDFYLAMGDDFSVDTLDPATVTASQVIERYTFQRPYLGLIGRSAPVFLVNGNHEQAARYLLDGTPNNVAVWAQNARNAHYSQPAPDGFYTGNTESVPYIGLLRNHYAWTWGDALFVVIDPYWSSPTCVDAPFNGGTKRSSLWDVTHGDAQYHWLKATLEQSSSRYKFVFAHHVMGTGRGGIDLAGLYEWGGYNVNGTWGFSANRPSWGSPIHKLLVDNKVNIFFQGHDHIWARQELDGVIYQTLPEPADPNYVLYYDEAFPTGIKFPNTGYTRIRVSTDKATVDYVRTYLPADESADRISGATAFSYVVAPTIPVPVAGFTVSPDVPTVGSSVNFTDTSINSPTYWLWNFGDNVTSNLQNPVHTFSSAGSYTVTLTVGNTGGTNQKSVAVTVIETVTVSASIAGGNGTVSPTAQTVNSGSPASIAITPVAGYRIKSITDNGNPVEIVTPCIIPNVTSAHSVVVTFEIIPAPLVISTTTVAAITVGTTISRLIDATGGIKPYIWSLASGTLPPGLTLNASTGYLTGTSTTIGSYSFTVKVTDSQSTPYTATKAFTLDVTVAPLTVSTTAMAATTVGTSTSRFIAAVGGVKPYTWTLASGTLPPGLTLNASTGYLTGMPTTTGSFSFIVKVTDSQTTAITVTKSFILDVTAAPLTVSAATLIATTVGTSTSRLFAATGGIKPYTWTLASGTLPPGLTLNTATGYLTGTPTTAGSFSFTVKATDSQAVPYTATRAFTLDVTIAPLAISTASLAAITVGTSTSRFFTATGGIKPYTWSLSAGSLPPGITLNSSGGYLSGKATTAGVYAFTIKVTDSQGTIMVKNMSLTVQ